jgi:hypothetical protein
MGFLPSFREQIKSPNVIPDSAQIPAAHTHFYEIVKALEPRLVLRLPSIAVATTEPQSIAPLENGMFVVTTSAPYEIYYRAANTWKKIYPVVYNGTAVPATGLGADDDLYVMY